MTKTQLTVQLLVMAWQSNYDSEILVKHHSANDDD